MITTREIVDRLKDLYDKLAAVASFRWGVVISEDPPLVRLDADTDPVIVGTTVPLTVGSRVLVLLQNRKNTVVGTTTRDLVITARALNPAVPASLAVTMTIPVPNHDPNQYLAFVSTEQATGTGGDRVTPHVEAHTATGVTVKLKNWTAASAAADTVWVNVQLVRKN